MSIPNPSQIVYRLRQFQRIVRGTIILAHKTAGLNDVGRSTAADTIYKIDTEVDPLLEAFCEDWARETPLILIAEGMEDEHGNEGPITFPRGTPPERAQIRLIVDPIDGTRGIMYDKRSAWALAGVAPNKGPGTRLRDIEVAVMTELPTSKMGFSDVLWAVKGQGARGIREQLDAPVFQQGREPGLEPDVMSVVTGEALNIRPSQVNNIAHGFASVANFFPGIKLLAGELMEHLAEKLMGKVDVGKAMVFDDQYISTGGQWYEMMIGHDRFIADLRPAFYRIQHQPLGLCCHPYDCATMLIAEEAGVIITDENGHALDGPMDTTTGLSWVAYANEELRRSIEPLLLEFLRQRV